MKIIFSACILLFVFMCACATPTTELNTLNKNITSIQADLKKSTAKKTQLQTALAQTESREGKIHLQIKNTQQNLSQKQVKLQQLNQTAIGLENEKNQDRALLKKQIRAAYLFSQQPAAKLLLSSNDHDKTQRILMYYHYITEAQMKTVQRLSQAINACTANQNAIQYVYKNLLTLKKTQLHNQQQLQQTEQKRQALIQTINQQIVTKHQKLTQLLWNKRQLEETLRELKVSATKQFISQKPLTHLHGTLPWPTKGMIRHAFGTPVEQSQLNWDGVVISAPVGQPVYAVASGRVIFAKWLAGYGLLLIIDDGNGYMTLYGRNQSLMKTVGQTVRAHEEIATVGKSGGFLQPGLYFSIRHNGQAVNPGVWCR